MQNSAFSSFSFDNGYGGDYPYVLQPGAVPIVSAYYNGLVLGVLTADFSTSGRLTALSGEPIVLNESCVEFPDLGTVLSAVTSGLRTIPP